MEIIWKYKIDVDDKNVFTEIENERKISFPAELKDLILNANAATPSSYNFMVGNNERVLGSILSFNRNERDTDSVFTAFAVINDSDLIPFGIDPFGNMKQAELIQRERHLMNLSKHFINKGRE